jgi:hypothetical protein
MVTYACRCCGHEQKLEAQFVPPCNRRCLRCALLTFLYPDQWERLTTRDRLDRQWPRE